MMPIGDVVKPAMERLEELARYRAEHRAEIIADGVVKHGWDPNAVCSNCGDTGMFPGGAHYCGCPVGVEAKAVADDEQRLQEWERHWIATGVPRRFRGYRFATSPVDSALIDEAMTWVSGDPVMSGRNLMVVGATGTGKSGIAISALRALHETGVQGLRFMTTVDLLDELKPNSGVDGTLVVCQRAKVLALDDIGTTRGTDWEQERLFSLLNHRYEAQLPTIITTNIVMSDLAAMIGDRIVSRLVEDCTVVAIDSPDMRRR